MMDRLRNSEPAPREDQDPREDQNPRKDQDQGEAPQGGDSGRGDSGRGDSGQGNRVLHGGVYTVMVAAWLWLLLVFWAIFGFERESAYMLVVATGLFFVFFGFSAILMGMQRDYETVRSSFVRYLKRRLETQSGPISGWDSLVQVALIPVSLALGGTVIGLIIVLARNGVLG